MSNELKGTIKEVFDIEKGTSRAGKEWQKRLFILTTDGQYPKDVAFTLMGDKTAYIDKYPVGSNVSVKFDLDSKEYNGKWFTNANAYSVFGEGSQKEEKLPSYESKGFTKHDGKVEPEGDLLPF